MFNTFAVIRPDHYIVTSGQGDKERAVFGARLPLSKKAASQYMRGNVPNGRVIKRTTATKLHLI